MLDDADGRAEHDQIGVLDAVADRGGDAIERPILQGSVEPPDVPADPHDLVGESLGPNSLGHRATEEPDADDREAADHGPFFPSAARRPLMSRRFSAGVPTVMRSVLSIPNAVIGRTMTPSCRSF